MNRNGSDYRRGSGRPSQRAGLYRQDSPYEYSDQGVYGMSGLNAGDSSQYSYSSQQYSRRSTYEVPQGGVGYSHTVRPSVQKSQKGSSGRFAPLIALIIGLLVGALGMFFALSFLPDVPSPVSSSLSERELDTVVGTYLFEGDVYEITAREAIVSSTGLSTRLNSDGTYQAPTADMVLSCARNQILNNLVLAHGIVVTDSEVAAYAQSVIGSSDMAVVAQYFGMDEDQAWAVMTEAAAVHKLRGTIENGPGNPPVPPAVPVDGNTEVANAEYATYIIGLLGGYWDSANGTWADINNPYYQVLSDKVFALGSANYEAAQAAYSVAYEQYLQGTSSSSDAWATYLNGYLYEASISIATLGA